MRRVEKERRVLAALTERGEMSGWPLSQAAGVPSAAVYAATTRLISRGLVAARVETDPPGGRPPRRLYRSTDVARATGGTVSINEDDPAPLPRYAWQVFQSETVPYEVVAAAVEFIDDVMRFVNDVDGVDVVAAFRLGPPPILGTRRGERVERGEGA